MPPAEKSRDLVRFADFELTVSTAELRKSDGTVLRLSEQPLRILIALLERPGGLVLREELRKRLWPNDTIVEFEHSISAAMNRLRQALGDSAENPQFIETLARRGYRWKTPVMWVAPESHVLPLTPATPTDGNLIGKKVSHYRVLGMVGGGGMGIVYKAEDIKLGRRVALKFLPEELAGDPLSMERFEREARAASTLNHPNICTIYEVEEHKGQPFIVMELLEGATLRDLISGSSSSPNLNGAVEPLPVARCLDIALQISDGLAAAHARGVIHRDIKPANIFLTSDGRVKILDFGLAKLQEMEVPEEGTPISGREMPNVSTGLHLTLTRTGLAIGTAGYMSPEQVRGEPLDTRTDLFSFGLVLYEIFTSHRAFTGDTAPMLHAAILERTPEPVRERNPAISPELARIIDHAMEKERAARYQTASAIRADLEEVRRKTSKQDFRWRPAAAITAFTLVATVLAWFGTRPTARPTSREFRQRQLTVNSSENPVTGGAISPDGKYLAFTDLDGIHLKLVESGEIQQIPAPVSFQGSSPDWEIGYWLPDSTHFFALSELPQQPSGLWNISVAGKMQRIAEAVNPWGVSPDGSLLAITRTNDHEIWLIDPNGEHVRKLCDSGDGSSFRAVQWSADGQRVAYIRSRLVDGKNQSQIETRDLNGGPPIVVLSGAAVRGLSQLEEGFRDLNWLPDGRLIYVGGDPDIHGLSCNLWEARVDKHTGKLISQPERFTNWAGFCVTNLSPTADGKKLVLNRSFDQWTVYSADFDSDKKQLSEPKKLTFTEDLSSPTGWTSDGTAVFVRSNREGTWGIYKQPFNGGTAEPVVTKLQDVSWSTPVSPDRQWLIYASRDASDSTEIVSLMRKPLSGGPPHEIAKGRYRNVACAVTDCVVEEATPDGKQIVLSVLDPIKGKDRELARFTNDHIGEFGWDLSRDGTQVVAFRDFDSHFQILTLGSTVKAREIQTKSATRVRNLQWAADGKGLFASILTPHGAQLAYLDLQGNLSGLWELRGHNVFLSGRPSPDGSHLAIQGSAGTSNMWMMENF